MELHEIRYFLAVWETRSFTRAAARLRMTQPALTRAIQKLEAELGGPLFSRERTGVVPTPLGERVRPDLEVALARTLAAQAEAARFLRLEAADLRVGVMCTIGPGRFAACLAHFRAAHPGIGVTLTESQPEPLAEALLEGRCDVALLARPEPLDARFRVEPLYRERFLVLFGAEHRFARSHAIPMRDMDGETYLERIHCEYDGPLAAALKAAGARVQVAWRSEREDWIQALVAEGLGVCFAPEDLLRHPGVDGRPVVEPAICREVMLVTVAGRRWSAPLARFVQTCRRHPWRGVSEAEAAA